MKKQIEDLGQSFNRRQRLHELTIALVHQQKDLELMDPETISASQATSSDATTDPARWLDRSRRALNHYQAIVRTAVTLDSLLDAEESSL